MRYYGGKNKLLDFIEAGVAKTELSRGAKFVDLFTGTTIVAQHFKKKGFTVLANDSLEFSFALAKTYIELNRIPKFQNLKKYARSDKINGQGPIVYLNSLSPKEGFMFENYCPDGKDSRKYFSNENGMKIDTIREKIEEWKELSAIDEMEYYYLITSLLESVNLVSNVAGTYGAYLKTWDKRAMNPLVLKDIEIISSDRKNVALKEDANALMKEMRSIDILYLDPPYNSRQYSSNYFILELIAEGWFCEERLIPNGKTGIINYGEKRSKYCYKGEAKKSLDDLISVAKAKYVLLSYNNEGVISDSEIEEITKKKGKVQLFKRPHKRYRSINQDSSKNTEERLHFIETEYAEKRANKLNGSDWLQYSFSIWRDIAKNEEERKLNHPAIFPMQLAERLIEIFTNGSGKNVLDCFAGSGSTLIAGLKKNMNVYGIDVSDEFKELFFHRVNNFYSKHVGNSKIEYFLGNSKDASRLIEPETIDLCITSPPYWNVLNARRTADLKDGRNYTDDVCDIGNIESYNDFMFELKNIMIEVTKTLRKNGYCIMVVMDIRRGSNFYSFHSDVSKIMQEIGLKFEDLLIWDRQKEYNNCKPLGYPNKFIVNKMHEYILVFRKNG